MRGLLELPPPPPRQGGGGPSVVKKSPTRARSACSCAGVIVEAMFCGVKGLCVRVRARALAARGEKRERVKRLALLFSGAGAAATDSARDRRLGLVRVLRVRARGP